MAKCEKCGAEIAAEETYEVNGKVYCEDCAAKSKTNPPRRCGE